MGLFSQVESPTAHQNVRARDLGATEREVKLGRAAGAGWGIAAISERISARA